MSIAQKLSQSQDKNLSCRDIALIVALNGKYLAVALVFTRLEQYHDARFFIEKNNMFVESIVAIVTPFANDMSIDFAALEQLLDWHIQSGTQGVVIAGTTGESPTLSDEEKLQLARFTVAKVAGRMKVILGNGSNNTEHSVRLTRALNDTGIDGFLTVTPYYNKPSDAGLLAHYQSIASATELPIILYNVPGRTQCDMSNTVVAKLAELNNVVGLKDATADLSRVSVLRQLCPPDFLLLSGDDATALAYGLAGGDGVISVTANVAPKQIAEMQRYMAQGKLAEARAIDRQLCHLHRDLFIEANPIAVKWAMQAINKLADAGLRLPLTTLSASGQKIITKTLQDSGLLEQEC